MRAFSLKAGLAAAIVSVSALGAFAAPALTNLQVQALQNHDATIDQPFQPMSGKTAAVQKAKVSSQYDKLEREAWQARQ